jgi:DNA-binding protein Fis
MNELISNQINITLKDKNKNLTFKISQMTPTTVLCQFVPQVVKGLSSEQLIQSFLNLVYYVTEKDNIDSQYLTATNYNIICNIFQNLNEEQLNKLYNLILSHVRLVNGSVDMAINLENINDYIKNKFLMIKLCEEVIKLTFKGVHEDFLELWGENLKPQKPE